MHIHSSYNMVLLIHLCIHLLQNMEPCRSSGSQVSNHELGSPSLEFTLGRPDWHGADHD
jgi:hypothetical protein